MEQTIAVTFQHLEATLARALEVSPVADPRQLTALLPTCSPPAERLILAEMIKVDMAKAADRQIRRTLSFYEAILLDYFPEGHVPLDLVLEEIQARRNFGEQLDLNDFKRRFPHLDSVLDDVLTRRSTTQPPQILEKAPDFEDGATVDDFAILRTLGRGGFASVYLARQCSMQRLVALKVSQRGSDEPIALSQLDHPNIVRVFDQRQINEPRAILLYMQYVPGGTLAEVIKETSDAELSDLNGRYVIDAIDRALTIAGQQLPERNNMRDALAELDWPRVVASLGVQLAEGLAAAHRSGIMHRDVKPANILLSAEGVPKLADFNVSYSGSAGCAGAAVHFGGSLAYMSPEQLQVASAKGAYQPEDLDNRADLYSLGIVLWELWQGRRPAVADRVIASWQEAVDQQLALRQAVPHIVRPASTAAARVLEKTLLKTLQFDRERRPSTGDALAGRLRLALRERAAGFFEPASGSTYARLRRWPVLLTTSLIIFIPNGLAGGLNYLYNLNSIRTNYSELEPRFVNVSIWVNCVAFPIGALFLMWLSRPIKRAMRAAHADQSTPGSELSSAWDLGHRAAMVGGMLWLIAGIAFPIILQWLEPRFRAMDAVEFFLSLAICGGIAWIYPFFGISLLVTEVYYPALVAPAMVDKDFAARADVLRKRATIYLTSAAVIPLCALMLLALQQTADEPDRQAGQFSLVMIVLTAVALLFAFIAHQRLCETTTELATILRPK